MNATPAHPLFSFTGRAARALVVLLAAGSAVSVQAQTYVSDFDSLGLGATADPARADQDGWRSQLAAEGNFGEIEDAIAHGGRALHETSLMGTPGELQTIDQHSLRLDPGPTPLRLRFDFYAKSNKYASNNPFSAFLSMGGIVDSAYDGLLSVGIGGGNGLTKAETGASIALSRYNGVDNNEPIALSVGQGLAWETWHTVEVTADFTAHEYLGIAVDGAFQSLTGLALPRGFGTSGPAYPDHLDTLSAQVIAHTFGGTVFTQDDIYWDNVQAVPEPTSLAVLALGALTLLRRRKVA